MRTGESVKARSALLALALMAAGCATEPAPEHGGRWRPVNRFAEAPQAVALHQVYEFYASPLDGTLKTMLTRWAIDSKMTLSYQAPMDYTLYGPVAEVRTDDLQKAASRLSALYAAHGVRVAIEGSQIVVRAASVTSPSPAAAK